MSLTQDRAQRRHLKNDSDSDESRTPFRRDRDRILYSSAFRRLSGITQVVAPGGSHPTHNRLTHSLEVAQIASSIAQRFLQSHEPDAFDDAGGLNADVCEAAALAHDLGHPPFGHVSETTLNSLLDEDSVDLGGFEGNAQSFRIVTMLSTRSAKFPGLDLTRATLSAMSKYPWARGENPQYPKKWGVYSTEIEDFDFSREHLPPDLKNRKTLEAEIMDIADDIAYAVHDLEDFYRVGMVPLEDLRSRVREQDRVLESLLSRNPSLNAADHEHAIRRVSHFFPPRSYTSVRQGKAALRSMTSTLVGRYIGGISYNADTRELQIHFELRAEIEVLKAITWYYVIGGRALLTTRHGYQTIIRSLYRIFSPHSQSEEQRQALPNLNMLPEFYVELVEQGDFSLATVRRTVADTIASLTEAQAINLYQRLTGQSLGAVLDPIL